MKDVCLGGALEWTDGHGRVAKVGWSSLGEIRFMQKMLCWKINVFPLWIQLVSGPVTQHMVCPCPHHRQAMFGVSRMGWLKQSV